MKAEIVGEEVHTYDIALEPGQHAHVIVDQGTVDLAVAVVAPNGEPLEEIDGRWHGPESVSVLSKVPGSYQLRVRSVLGSAAAQPYRVTVVAIRPLGSDDEQRMRAERLATTAKPLITQANAASLKTALETYQQALPLWRAVGDRYGEAQTLNSLGHVSLAAGDSDGALAPLQNADAIWRDLGYATGEAETVGNLGVVYSRKGQKRQAIAFFERALAIRQRSGSAGEMAALINLGTVYADLGEAEKGLEYFKRALTLAEDARDRAAILAALSNVAAAYELLGEPGRALEFYDRGMALCRETNDTRCAAVMLLNRGTSSRRLGDHERALRQFEEAAQLAKTLPDQTVFGLAVVNIGVAHQELGQQDEALAHYAEALPILQKTRNSRGEGLAQLQIGEIHRQRQESGSALQCFDRGLALMQSAGDPRNEAQAHHGIARVQQSLGNTVAAKEHLERALALARATRDVHNEAQMLLSLANVERDARELSDAKANLDAALQLIEGLRARVSRQPLRTTLLASKQEYYEASIDTLMRLHAEQNARGFDAQALETSERARARSLLDLLVEAGANVREGVDPALLDRERSLRQLLNGKSDKQVALLSAKQTVPAALELEGEIDDTITALQAVEADIRSRSPRYAALTQPQLLTVADLRREVLDEETALIEYSLGREHSYVWALTTTGLVSARLPSRAVVEQAARELYHALTARSQRPRGETAAEWVQRIRKADAQLADTAAAVSQVVLSPVAAGLAKRRLLIVSDGALSYLPFGVLPNPNAPDRRPLLVDHEIVTAPSASVLTMLRRELTGRKTPPLTAAIIADPVFEAGDSRVRRPATRSGPQPSLRSQPDRSTLRDLERSTMDLGVSSPLTLNRLFASRDDALAIRSLAPGGQSLEALDFDANLATATSPKLAQYAIVHFATHTLINTLHPELSGIILSLVNEAGDSQPGFLRLHDIYNLRLPVELVVLSACQTALGQEVKGEGLVGLSRGFMYAGAPRVVVSLWKVDDKATSVLMGHFYREMLRGRQTPAAALRAAQRRMKEDHQWSHPFHWAGFIIQGEWR